MNRCDGCQNAGSRATQRTRSWAARRTGQAHNATGAQDGAGVEHARRTALQPALIAQNATGAQNGAQSRVARGQRPCSLPSSRRTQQAHTTGRSRGLRKANSPAARPSSRALVAAPSSRVLIARSHRAPSSRALIARPHRARMIYSQEGHGPVYPFRFRRSESERTAWLFFDSSCSRRLRAAAFWSIH